MSDFRSELEDPHETYNWGNYDASELESVRRRIKDLANHYGWDYIILEEHEARAVYDFLEIMVNDIYEFIDGIKSDEDMLNMYDNDFTLDRIHNARCILRECGGSSD